MTSLPSPSPPVLAYHTHLIDEFLASHPDAGSSIYVSSTGFGRSDSAELANYYGRKSRTPSPSSNNRRRRSSVSPAVAKAHRNMKHRSFASLAANRHRLAVRLGDIANDDYRPDAAHRKADIVDMDEMFETVRTLGSGASGVVTLVRVRTPYVLRRKFPDRNEYVAKGTHFALKTIPKSSIADKVFLSSIFSESFLQREVRHPHIARLLDVFESYNEIYFLNEFCAGGDLLSYLKRIDRPMTIDEVASCTRQLLDALTFLHDRGIAHRDLKLQNVLVASPVPVPEVDDGGEQRGRGRDGRRNSGSSSRRGSVASRERVDRMGTGERPGSRSRTPTPLPAETVVVNGRTLELPATVIPPRSSSLSWESSNETDDLPGRTNPDEDDHEPSPTSPNPRTSALPFPAKTETAGTTASNDTSRRPVSPMLSVTLAPSELDPPPFPRLDTPPTVQPTPTSTSRPASNLLDSDLYHTTESLDLPSFNNSDDLIVKLTDFGFATIVTPDNPVSAPTYRYGTPRYMAPEVVDPTGWKGWDGREADIWAIGVIFFALLFEEFPFMGRTEEELEDNITRGDIVIPADHLDSLPEEATDLVHALLHKNPVSRLTAWSALSHPFFKSYGTQIHPPDSRSLSDILFKNPLTKPISDIIEEGAIARHRKRIQELGLSFNEAAAELWAEHERKTIEVVGSFGSLGSLTGRGSLG